MRLKIGPISCMIYWVKPPKQTLGHAQATTLADASKSFILHSKGCFSTRVFCIPGYLAKSGRISVCHNCRD